MRKLLVIALFANAAMLAVRVVQEARPTPVQAQAVPTEIVIDNGQPGTSSRGNWAVSGGTNPYGGNSLYSSTAGNWYRWTFTVPESGVWDVEAWWTTYPSRNPAATYSILWTGGDRGDEATVDQRADGGRWNRLKTYDLPAGTTVMVTVLAVTGHSTSADAIRLVRQAESIPHLTLEEKEVLSHFSFDRSQPFRPAVPGEPQEANRTAVLTISGCSIHLKDASGEPGALLIGSDTVLLPGPAWPTRGARIQGPVEAASFTEAP